MYLDMIMIRRLAVMGVDGLLSRHLVDVSKVGIIVDYVVEMVVLGMSFLYSGGRNLMEGEGMAIYVIGGGGSVKED